MKKHQKKAKLCVFFLLVSHLVQKYEIKYFIFGLKSDKVTAFLVAKFN